MLGEVGVEEAADGGVEGGLIGWGGEFECGFRVGGLLEGCWRLAGGVGDEEFWGLQGAEWGGQREVFVEEQADRGHAGAWVGDDAGLEVAVGRLEDEGGQVFVVGG